jgi:hypothetical protein
MAAWTLICPPTTSVLSWLGEASCYRCGPRVASLSCGPRTRSSSSFPSKGWSGKRWLWITICSTSRKRRWQLLARLRPRGPGKSDSLRFGTKGLDFLLQLSTCSGAGPRLGPVEGGYGFTPGKDAGKRAESYLKGQLSCLMGCSSSSPIPILLSLPIQLCPLPPHPFR